MDWRQPAAGSIGTYLCALFAQVKVVGGGYDDDDPAKQLLPRCPERRWLGSCFQEATTARPAGVQVEVHGGGRWSLTFGGGVGDAVLGCGRWPRSRAPSGWVLRPIGDLGPVGLPAFRGRLREGLFRRGAHRSARSWIHKILGRGFPLGRLAFRLFLALLAVGAVVVSDVGVGLTSERRMGGSIDPPEAEASLACPPLASLASEAGFPSACGRDTAVRMISFFAGDMAPEATDELRNSCSWSDGRSATGGWRRRAAVKYKSGRSSSVPVVRPASPSVLLSARRSSDDDDDDDDDNVSSWHCQLPVQEPSPYFTIASLQKATGAGAFNKMSQEDRHKPIFLLCKARETCRAKSSPCSGSCRCHIWIVFSIEALASAHGFVIKTWPKLVTVQSEPEPTAVIEVSLNYCP
ncbi:hypothetical protein C0J52_26794 [Blattella germanica]|nr:hypothetical protein C0J52_26794 [Blattella germanica]